MSRGLTKPWLLGAFLMNIIGGRSSRYQLAGISIRSVSWPRCSGTIHSDGFFRIIDLRPFVADTDIIGLVIVGGSAGDRI